MEDIASAAGTSKSVYYRYFGDRAGLQQAMGEAVISRMQDKVLTAARAARTPRERLHAMVAAYLHMAQSSPHVYAFVTRPELPAPQPELPDPAAPPASTGALAHFFDAVAGMLSGSLRANPAARDSGEHTGPAVDYWPRAAIGMVRAAGEEWLAAPAQPDKPGEEEMATLLTDWLLRGMGGTTAHLPGEPSRARSARDAQ
jgi:AcrR family transcriptional regulator